ncbi:DUF418 domain-containing protein [Sphingomicrobium flavum]|uniref:DUF418 domain-containing protein n=1 Tax=Sphingomicrobium flavum TaxID=1229164 RepID=UPI0021ADE49C|nr:DUF418 domain-containing protein [Sphingomicrobium flavum]
MFATLFGMGFWIMLERLKARGEHFEQLYLRRLIVLLAIGAINIFLIFPGDVLHEYAMIAFILFALRGLSPKAMLLLGLLLGLLARPLVEWWLHSMGVSTSAFGTVQKEAFAAGGYWNWVKMTAIAHVDRDILHGGLAAWALYILGRFLLGAFIIRKGWIQNSADHLPTIRRLFLIALPLGLLIELYTTMLWLDYLPGPQWWAEATHLVGAPLTAFGYALGLILLFHRHRDFAARTLAPVGRVALTAYVAHAALFTLLFMPFGFDLLGRINPALALAIAIGIYALITLAAAAWLHRYRYGPLEYLWRWGTYGKRPALRRQPD